jgi:tetratricopeptide repeat protein 30
MQEQDKFAEALRYYEPFVQQFEESICDVQAIVLANLCVSYIMTTQNEEAEEIMRKIEREEEQIQFRDPEKQCLHLCIVNLVIGTLYCTKGNYEFGISRIIKSMEPYDKKLDMDTWCVVVFAFSLSTDTHSLTQMLASYHSSLSPSFSLSSPRRYYAKRCLATFAEMVAKHIVIMKDQTYYDITTFLEAAERFGKDIKTVNDTGATDPLEAVGSSRTVSYEARVLKTLFMRLHGE